TSVACGPTTGASLHSCPCSSVPKRRNRSRRESRTFIGIRFRENIALWRRQPITEMRWLNDLLRSQCTNESYLRQRNRGARILRRSDWEKVSRPLKLTLWLFLCFLHVVH